MKRCTLNAQITNSHETKRMGCYHKYRHHRRSSLYTFVVIVLLHHCLDATTAAAATAAVSCSASLIIFVVKLMFALIVAQRSTHMQSCKHTQTLEIRMCFCRLIEIPQNTPTRVHIALHTRKHKLKWVFGFSQLMPC